MPSPTSQESVQEVKAAKRAALWRAIRRFPFQEPEFRNRRIASRAALLLLLSASAVFGVMVGLLLVFSINLPQISELERYHPSIRIVSAAYQDMHSDRKSQGASTLTMQLARNLFLSSEKTYGRKLQEVFLTIQIERHFTKKQIFTLYANQIYLGRGTYGFEAGSEYYFSKKARDLTLPEAALLAALPKGPESYSPVRFPERALRRRNLVLDEMLSDHKITAAEAAAAKAAPLGLNLEAPSNTEAPYFVEEVRRQLESEYGTDEVHGAGLRVYTTLDLDLQHAAEKAVLDGTANYERRHGWKGRLENVVSEGADLESYKHPDWTQPVVDGAYFFAAGTAAEGTLLALPQ